MRYKRITSGEPKNRKIFHSVVGKTFNRLTIISEPYSEVVGGKKRRIVDCVCSCGVGRKVLLNSVMSGHSQSCGCVKLKFEEREKAKIMRTTFSAMKQRCNNPKCESYPRYGGRGIKVCEEWTYFPDFYRDMEATWQKGLEIDRINFNKGYYKENCRWVTEQVQQRNRSDVVFNEAKVAEVRASKLTQPQLAEKYNVNQSTISRIKNNKRWIIT